MSEKDVPFEIVRIALVCGCSVVTRDTPHDGQTFMCRSGLGHGYKGQVWVSWTYGERSGSNPRLQGEGKTDEPSG